MLNKYVGETSTLFPSDIPGSQKDGYTYEWRYRHQVFSTSYAAKFTFNRHGLHEFELTVTDKTTRMKSTQYYYVEATLRNKPYMGNKFQFVITAVVGSRQDVGVLLPGTKPTGGIASPIFYFGGPGSDDEAPTIGESNVSLIDDLGMLPLRGCWAVETVNWYWEDKPSGGVPFPEAPTSLYGLQKAQIEFNTSLVVPGGPATLQIRVVPNGFNKVQVWQLITSNHPNWAQLRGYNPNTNALIRLSWFLPVTRVTIVHPPSNEVTDIVRGIPVQFICIPETLDFDINEHEVLWEFDDGGEPLYGPTVTRVCTQLGVQRAYVYVYNQATHDSAGAGVEFNVFEIPPP